MLGTLDCAFLDLGVLDGLGDTTTDLVADLFSTVEVLDFLATVEVGVFFVLTSEVTVFGELLPGGRLAFDFALLTGFDSGVLGDFSAVLGVDTTLEAAFWSLDFGLVDATLEVGLVLGFAATVLLATVDVTLD